LTLLLFTSYETFQSYLLYAQIRAVQNVLFHSKLCSGSAHFIIVNNCLNTNIYSYSETSGGQSSNLYIMLLVFSTPVLIRHLWQLKTAVFLHWCLIRAILLQNLKRKVEFTQNSAIPSRRANSAKGHRQFLIGSLKDD
jgi:hypothetical protein